MPECLLMLGADLGDPPAQLEDAQRRIGEQVGRVLARSRDHWTEPWGFAGSGLFLNRALLVDVELQPDEMLRVLLGIEGDMGRKRTAGSGYASRLIDIDMLLYDGVVWDSAELQLPHLQLHRRAFALAPAADVAPLMVHPHLGRTLLDLLDDLRQPTHNADR